MVGVDYTAGPQRRRECSGLTPDETRPRTARHKGLIRSNPSGGPGRRAPRVRIPNRRCTFFAGSVLRRAAQRPTNCRGLRHCSIGSSRRGTGRRRRTGYVSGRAWKVTT